MDRDGVATEPSIKYNNYMKAIYNAEKIYIPHM